MTGIHRSSCPGADGFAASRQRLENVVQWLDGEAAELSHAELESHLQAEGRELLRQLLQDHFDLRAEGEERLDVVVDGDGVARRTVEPSERTLTTIFGNVTVRRLAYRQREHTNLHPADAMLNLPVEKHSHGLRHLAAVEASRGSFDEAVDAVERTTGRRVGKRQVEQLTGRAARDVDEFYASPANPPAPAKPGDALVISVDGKGIVMRPDALRVATAKKAQQTAGKLQTRLSKGEKPNRKRLAEVGAVYDLTPVPRTPADILESHTDSSARAPAPVARNKWLTASVIDDAAEVVADVFDEAERRDPKHHRTWVALVDGNNHQLNRITTEAATRGITVSIVIDFIHVLEYLWKAAWCFFQEADPAAETWVNEKALQILQGHSSLVAAAIRRTATRRHLAPAARSNADTCADYLLRKRPYLDYPTALTHGWPIATGVIEGACRHLVKDRMDLTGARWGLQGAEAVLKLRAVRTNGDFDEYWRFHLAQEQQRVHANRYIHQVIPRAA